MEPELTAERIRELLDYDPNTGIFTWRIKRSGTALAGSVAGWMRPDGYLVISIDDKPYKAHRLAWLLATGKWPTRAIDHINQIKGDNRICNLREVNASESCQNRPLFRNNTSGFRGVSWHKKVGRWFAYIKHLGKRHFLGYFDTPEEASAAYKEAASRLHTHNPEAMQ